MKVISISVLLLLVVYNVDALPKPFAKADETYAEEEVALKLEEYNELAVEKCNARSLASWEVETNVGVQALVDDYQATVADYANFRKDQYNSYFSEAIRRMKAGEYTDELLVRQLRSLDNMGTSLLDETDLNQLTSARAQMSAIYNSAKICPYDDQDCDSPTWSLDEEIQNRMSKSRDYDELEYIFNEWHEQSGTNMISNYEEYVGIMNKAALLNDYKDAGEMWISTYEDDNFKNNIDALWDQVEPLYDELHKYVKHKLSKIYPGKFDAKGDTIPAHILGNMWAQTWEDLYEDLKPYKNAGSIDVDAKMLELNYDVHKMFEMSDDFYQSMGLKSNEMSYNVRAMIEKPDGKTVACHASAWDFCNGEDFRIKMCTHVDMHDFLVVHHEMGHIQYFLQYKDNPLTLRGGANPGFHEAVGDTIALSVDTAKHLKKVDLLGDDYIESEESQINALFAMALKRVAFLPFGLLIDKWRWEVFSGEVIKEKWNERWWELRKQYQKVAPPTNRDSDEYFDPGAKFHIPNDSQYIAYFVAHILEFQMYRALCIEANEYGPAVPDAKLHNCDFYESTDAGTKLAAGLSLGTSKHWSEALEAITGSRVISSEAILEYFAPLLDYMKKYNKAIEDLEIYNEVAPKECNKIVKAEWDVNTDVENDEKQEMLSTVTISYSQFLKDQVTIFNEVKPEDFDDELEQRQIREIKKLGTAILIDDDLSELQKTISDMEKIYNTATICPYDDTDCETKWSLDPDMEARLAESTDYDELEYVWKEWRDNSGKLMREHYKKYVTLSNKAAVANGYEDYGEMWRDSYEDNKFDENIERMWEEVKELYDELHKYVLKKLKTLYGSRLDAYENTIPAHILGNMWAQSWVHLYDRIQPFTNGSLIDVTEAIKAKYTVKEMFEEADQFYIGLGLEPMPMSYDEELALITKPDNRKVACHASAWDFCDGEDFRIKMCTNLNMEDFVTIHHEMGHIQYYLLYKDLPIALRGGANPGFHEAVGDLIALSVSTPKHLQQVGLLQDYEDSRENDINSLFKMALERVAFLPFGLLIDKWRWDVFSGKVEEDEWNSYWWELRERYQKVVSPVARSEEDFDPGAKYHIPADSKYISYFIAHILEFQLHRAVCIEAGEYDPDDETKPLYKCDIDKNTDAGKKIRDGLSLGFSKHWSESLKAMTGETEISGAALMEYFAPLLTFLKEQNEDKGPEEESYDEEEVAAKLEEYNVLAVEKCNARSLASWEVETNVGVAELVDDYQEKVADFANFRKDQYNSYFSEAIRRMKAGEYTDELLVRQLRSLDNMGTSLLDETDLNQLTSARAQMSAIYNSAKICPYDDQDCDSPTWSLDEEIQNRMSKSRDYDELEYIFNEWHEQSGTNMISNYEEYVGIMNKAALLNDYKDAGEMWISTYEDDNFKNNIDALWDQVEPLYDELHKYVKHKLSKIYPGKFDAKGDTIPAHILGNMWAQTWEDLYEDLKPYKNAGSIDVDAKMLELNYDVHKMFEMSDDFYQSMGLKSNEMSYNVRAMIEKPDGKTVACHASAWDFCDGEDFRIKMCTHVDMHDFLVVHHEMGHIQYFLQYKDNPLTLRGGANPGFHEAVGDTIALSVDTAKHLKKVDLLGDDYIESEESQINALFAMALKRVAFLPFGLLIDKWRWEVFSGEVSKEKWNERWWELRKQYQKVAPPTNRDSDEYFDPGAKFHIPNDSQYIAYFVAHILEFQMYRALCIEANEYGPAVPDAKLHNCDFYESTDAGTKLAAGLSLGTSKHWSEALEAITGSKVISSEAILEYFAPLLDYMKKYNKAIEDLEIYNEVAPKECNKIVKAEWDVNTDVENDEKQEVLSTVTISYSQFLKDQATIFNEVKPEDFDDELEQRQIREIKKLGTAILMDDDLSELQKTISDMEKIYNTATICPYGVVECEVEWSLDPDMEARLAVSTDYDELQYIWKEWRDNSGKLMREHYKKYVTLSNKAAVANGFDDYGEMWRDMYEDDKFEENIDRMWEEVKELYDELHKYVLKKLKTLYGSRLDAYENTIPAHILGNMWAQSWVHLYDRIQPFTNGSLIDVTEAIKAKYTVKEMFEEADQFYIGLGLEPMSMSYDEELALITKPDNRKVACHASAWDFCDGEDFRIKMCTNLNMEDFVTIHHEMGHIQYFLLYKDLPIALRDAANPGFHEAVGDLIALSVSTPKHLQTVGLLQGYEDSRENDINSLFRMALERVAFLPFGLLIDKWRWDVFSGKVEEDEWNSYWWELRERYQKVVSPVARSEEDFDPGAKFHVPADGKYISYFIAHILEFQLHRAVCIEAGEYDPDDETKPLYKCDIDKNIDAGQKIRDGLSLGFSKHWSESLKAMTGETEISGNALMEYFAPLLTFLKEQNEDKGPEEESYDEEEVAAKLEEYNVLAVEKCNARSLASWEVETNVGVTALVDDYQAKVADFAKFRKDQYNSYFSEAIRRMKAGEYTDELLVRQLRSLDNMGTSLLDEADLNLLTSSRAQMTAIYNSAKICSYEDQDCDTPTWSLDSEIQSRMSKSRDYDELEYIFNEWHEQSGKNMISNYEEYVGIMNKAALLNDYEDAGEMWISTYEDTNFKNNIDALWDQVEPLYDELHKYVKHKLSKIYPGKFDAKGDTIPAHILGNMWAQTWEDLYEDLKPYKNAGSIDVDAKMLELSYDVHKMFEMSDDFYQSMGLKSNEMSYKVPPAMIEKPDGKTVACHASAWDFCDGEDFRIKMCTHVDKHDFLVVHHEMGHIQYYLQYKDNPLTLRGGANPGFHEAVGDTIALSVDTAKYLKKVDLLGDDYIESEESQINALFAMALKRVAFLPFGLLIDKWRWEVFSGEVNKENWNKRWWELRKQYQKVAPPTNRDSDEYFDPGAKFHIPNDSQYIAYFVAHILEFQMYRALCIEANEYGPAVPDAKLHNCDFYESTDAGTKLAAGLSLGTSKHWSEALEAITGSKVISSEAILEYFAPLMDYMKKYNKAIEDLEIYNEVAPKECNKIVKAEWDVNTDVENDEKQEVLSTVTISYSQFLKTQANIFNEVKPEDFDDELEQRQIREIKKLGTAILMDDDLSELQKTISDMEKIYNTATICPYGVVECEVEWSLDPDMEARLAASTDYDELQYIWKEWRDNSGKLMREHYKKYVTLSNKAAVANGFEDYGEMWRDMYEDDKFEENIDRMWEEVKELYDELHKYVLKKLKTLYGSRLDAYENTIPAHILGNMWAQSWVHLYDRIQPFTNGSLIDITEAIKAKYTVKEMFEEADQFYIGLGLEPMSMSYDEDLALITKPDNRKVACHASAWDFCDGEDFRIKMCTNLNMEDFVTIHHEMGHIQYFLLYKDLPIALRDAANPGFHEAVGDLIALSVSTPKHLQTVGLLQGYEDSRENDINSLFRMALERVAFLPFGLLIDKWRWDVFSGKVEEDEWNSYWWELRERYQKVVSPVARSEEDFDPGAKFHIPADGKYISYFIAHILEFQLHRAVCIEAGEYDPDDETKPLYKCDIDKNTAAGKKIRDGLSLGFSKHWSESLKAMTGETEISGTALMEYFAPLLTFLKEQNAIKDSEDGGDGAGAIIGGDKGIVISIALIAYGIFSCIRR